MKSSSLLIGAVVVVLVIVGVLVLSKGKSSPAPEQQVPVQQVEQGTSTAESTTRVSNPAPIAKPPASKSVTITYDGSSFSPSTVTIAVGDKVTFVDSSSNPMWIASSIHPSHMTYDGTNTFQHCAGGYSGPAPFDECKASIASYSFTFTKAGTWPFHNHLNAGATGTVVVK